MNYAFLATIVGFSVLSGVVLVNNKDAKEIEKIKIANEVIEKKEELKEYASLQSVNYKNSSSISSESEIAGDNIMKIIVPSENTPHGVKMVVSKYQHAINKWYSTRDTSSVPSCKELSQAELITLEDCERAIEVKLDVYSYENGAVAYNTSTELGEKISKIRSGASQEKVSQTETTNQFLDKGQATASFDEITFSNEVAKISNLKKLIHEDIRDNPLKAAKINNELAKIDKISALNNALEIVNVLNTNTKLSTSDIALTTQELQKTIYICRNSYLKFVPTEIYANEQSAKSYMIQNNLEINNKTNTLENYIKSKLSISQINSINDSVDKTIINSDASINTNFNLWKGN